MKRTHINGSARFISCALIPLFMVLAAPAILAQQLTGNLQDAAGQPIYAANVLLLAPADSSLVNGELTDSDGHFTFENVANGSYLLSFSMLGFETVFINNLTVDESHPLIDLKTTTLRENATLLAEVSVVAKRPFLEQKIDRMVVNVSNSITNAGGTALQVLQRSPGVQVNALTKSISLAGKQGVVVMINGKISRMPSEAVVDMLAGMNADNIDRIELIHTPPANFEAEGNAGIINIVLKQSGDKGLNGGYTTKIGQGRGAKAGASGYFNQRSGKVNLFGSYDLDYNLNPQTFTNYRRVATAGDVLETASISDRSHTPTTTQNARIGADLQVSKKTVVGVLGTFLDRNWYMEAENAITYSRNGKVESLLRMPNTETNHSQSLAGNLNLSHQFSDNQSLSVDADYIHYTISNPSSYRLLNQDASGNLTTESELRIAKETPIQVGVAKADYTKGFGENTRLEMGAKLTSMRFMNDVQVDERAGQEAWQQIPNLTSVSQMKETVAGAFVSVSTKLGDNIDLKAGLRYEHTDTRLDSGTAVVILDRNYGSWFPTVFLSRKISENQTFNFSYSRRISRPSIGRLAPFLIFSDPTTLLTGNPALQPAFTNAFNLSYNVKSWRLGVTYSIEDAPQRFIPEVDAQTNRQVLSFGNMGQERTWSANLYIPLQLADWWEMSNNLYFSSLALDFELEGEPLKVKNLAYGFNSNHSFKLPKQFSLEVTGNFDSPSYWGIAYWRATGSLNIGIEKNFGEKWGKVRLTANDLFRSSNWFGTTDQPEIDLLTKQSFQWSERVFMLSWSNTFGNKKIKAARQRQTGAVEEWRRL
ncbi:MAG: hypothetical protein DA408_19880 [Bacteroidetes bacterium]|nr:MAG: hypothetical protein DA408_19880 [Bacteroidota bacterium]